MNIKNTSHILLLTFAGVLSGTATAQNLLFADNFEGWTAGAPVTDNGISPTRWDPDNNLNIIEIDTGNAFGAGTSNQFMRLGNLPIPTTTLLDGGQKRINQRNYAGFATTGVLSVSFDLIEPSSGNGKGLVSDLSDRSFFRIRGDSAGTGLQTIRLQNGRLRQDGSTGPMNNGDDLALFSEDVLTNFVFIYNQSGADISHNGKTLSSGQYDVYIDGTLAIADLESGKTNPTDDFARLYFETDYATAGTSAQELWIDNWAVYDGAVAIPEPAMLGLLLGFGGLGMMVLRRRR